MMAVLTKIVTLITFVGFCMFDLILALVIKNSKMKKWKGFERFG